MTLEAGKQLLHYRLVEQIGEGGMGVVWRATDTTLGRDVAIKVLPEHVAANPELKQRFEREARTIAALNHPHICTRLRVNRSPLRTAPGSVSQSGFGLRRTVHLSPLDRWETDPKDQVRSHPRRQPPGSPARPHFGRAKTYNAFPPSGW